MGSDNGQNELDGNYDKGPKLPAYVDERRELLRELGHPLPESSRNTPPVGLAFSGGGIRSATTSLGVVQALVRHDRFFGFDYMSSSSGGGYLACFLRSLFLPGEEREAISAEGRELKTHSDYNDQRMAYCHEAEIAANRLAARGRDLTDHVFVIEHQGKAAGQLSKPSEIKPLSSEEMVDTWWQDHGLPQLNEYQTPSADQWNAALLEKAKEVQAQFKKVLEANRSAEKAHQSVESHGSRAAIKTFRKDALDAKDARQKLEKLVDEARAIHQKTKAEARRDRFEFAKRSLSSAPGDKQIKNHTINLNNDKHKALRHPVHWLREHGRYLAPGGAMDFSSGVSLVIRNWLGLMFTIGLAFAMVLFGIQLVLVAVFSLPWVFEGLLQPYFDCWILQSRSCAEVTVPNHHLPIIFKIGPLVILACFAAFLSLSSAIAYMITHRVPYHPLARRMQDQNPTEQLKASFRLAWFMLGLSLVAGCLVFLSSANVSGIGWSAPFSLDIRANLSASLGLFAFLWLATLVGRGLVSRAAQKTNFFDGDHANKAQLLRRWLLEQQNLFNLFFFGFLYVALVDTIAIHWHDAIRAYDTDTESGESSALLAGFFAVILQPLGAYLIQKVPSLFGESDNPVVAFLKKRVSLLALIAGAALMSVTAIGTSMLVHFAFWEEDAWGSIDLAKAALFGVIIYLFGFVIGTSRNIMNLTSLHAFYSARLTRAYLGATNIDRLKWTKDVKEDMDFRHDHIDAFSYFRATLAAPFHLLNVTINDTISKENLIARDRKSRRGTFEFEGLTIQGGKNSWLRKLRDAEWLTVGQMCAISGAAASSGMGRLTSLGTALALSFANVRLGYWWNRGNPPLATEKPPQEKDTTIGRPPLKAVVNEGWFTRVFPTFASLLNEMQARFPLTDQRIYLSDAGHSENTGAMALLDKDCRHLLVCDNGADPNYEFADLETLIRTARIDENFTIREATRAETVSYCGHFRHNAQRCFFNMQPNWREAVAEHGGPAFALLLRARKIESSVEKGDRNEKDEANATYIVWLKPRIFDGLPPDLVAYAKASRPFPNHSTSDQFFDEAQWESYRRIGYEMIQRLFKDTDALPSFPLVIASNQRSRYSAQKPLRQTQRQ